jgi:hypothetical protein
LTHGEVFELRQGNPTVNDPRTYSNNRYFNSTRSILIPVNMASANNPAATMSDDAARTLWCLIEGESTPFGVTAPANAIIEDLKKLIHQEKEKGILRDINAVDLVLWKVSSFYRPVQMF